MQISQPCLCPGCVDLKSVEYLYLFVRIPPSTSLSWQKLCIKRLNIWNWRKICRKVIPNIDMKFRPKVPIFPRKRLAITAGKRQPSSPTPPPTPHNNKQESSDNNKNSFNSFSTWHMYWPSSERSTSLQKLCTDTNWCDLYYNLDNDPLIQVWMDVI